jgi:hypothetical protein
MEILTEVLEDLRRRERYCAEVGNPEVEATPRDFVYKDRTVFCDGSTICIWETLQQCLDALPEYSGCRVLSVRQIDGDSQVDGFIDYKDVLKDLSPEPVVSVAVATNENL